MKTKYKNMIRILNTMTYFLSKPMLCNIRYEDSEKRIIWTWYKFTYLLWKQWKQSRSEHSEIDPAEPGMNH